VVIARAREALIYSWARDREFKAFKCKALNAGNIENIIKFSNAAVEGVRHSSAAHGINQMFPRSNRANYKLTD